MPRGAQRTFFCSSFIKSLGTTVLNVHRLKNSKFSQQHAFTFLSAILCIIQVVRKTFTYNFLRFLTLILKLFWETKFQSFSTVLIIQIYFRVQSLFWFSKNTILGGSESCHLLLKWTVRWSLWSFMDKIRIFDHINQMFTIEEPLANSYNW